MGSTSEPLASSSHPRPGQEPQSLGEELQKLGFYIYFFFSPCIAEGVVSAVFIWGGRGSLQAA